MGYYIRFLPKKKNAPIWKLQFVSARKADQRESSAAANPKRAWDISKDRWSSLGFHASMSLQDARVRGRQLNADLRLKQQELRLKQLRDKELKFQLLNAAALPEEFVSEFEERFVRPRNDLSKKEYKARHHSRFTAWRTAQKIIVAVGVEPTNWLYHQDRFYDQFHKCQFSIGYVQRVLAMINLWGHFITRKLCQPYYAVRAPKGYERQRLLEAFYSKSSRRRVPSAPITPELLSKINGIMNAVNFNWLYISVWLGLRPQEIDNILDDRMWKVETLPTGRKIIWVYQTKIVALPPEDRWKPIPILFDEQHFALKIIADKNFKRPLTKTVSKYIGPKHDLYGGRKGFVDLMLYKGQMLENISIWMGHSTLNRTWRSYKNKKIYHGD